ncbi:MAG: carboxynorspermidine decarboxylase [Acholeplasmatales bacterium]|nr:carboxynorspermidine decarboxylase [Acholeplasmatales bacterium]
MIKDLRPPFVRLNDFNPDELFKDLKTPCYVIDEKGLIYDGEILKRVSEESGARILLAQKAFSNFNLYNVIEPYIYGTEASGLYEARLGREEMPNKEVHVFCAAYRDDEIDEVISYADHIIFNSINQLKKFGSRVKEAGKEVGVRINPEYSTQPGHEIYDPCSSGSRLGITIADFKDNMTPELLGLLDGIHFHTLCQQNSDDLEATLNVVIEKFGSYFKDLKWINFGGGHHITRFDYDIDRLIRCIKLVKDKYNVEVYLEPGEAVVLNAGFLLTRVLDTFNKNGQKFAIVDTSAACHFPDVIEMPFLPPLYKADLESNNIDYRIGCPTCLTGDVIGNYKFDSDLKENEMLIFGDMALYTTCKNNTFNGMPLPDIYVLHNDNSIEKLTSFGYNDFKYRLGKMN